MAAEQREFSPGPRPRTVCSPSGEVLEVPAQWALLPPGDAALTRRVKAAGPSWPVKEKRGRKRFSQGVWAPSETIARLRSELRSEREDPKYARRLAAGRERRAAEQVRYAADFEGAVFEFLAFAPRHRELGLRVAKAIATHAVPVGSGTVARTKRISVERRAEAATIAWLRHQTTGYDELEIPRVKGMRREVRRMLAARSRELLRRYRGGEAIAAARCVLEQGLRRAVAAALDAQPDDAQDDEDDDLL